MWQRFPENTRFWNERDWELFFSEQDANATSGLRESGDAHPIAGVLDEHAEGVCPDCAESDDEDDLEDALHGDDYDTDDDDEYETALEDELNDIHAWRSAIELSDAVYEYVSPMCQREVGDKNQEVCRGLCQESYMIGDYIAGGHEMGYDEDLICGNIAMCNRALISLDRCIHYLNELSETTSETVQRLMLRSKIVRSFLLRRIDDLRKRVWWQ